MMYMNMSLALHGTTTYTLWYFMEQPHIPYGTTTYTLWDNHIYVIFEHVPALSALLHGTTTYTF